MVALQHFGLYGKPVQNSTVSGGNFSFVYRPSPDDGFGGLHAPETCNMCSMKETNKK
jgi:hypothetical protein